MLHTLISIIRKPRYITIALLVFIIVLVGALVLPNIRLLIEVSKTPGASFSDVLLLTLRLMGSIKTNFTIVSATNTVFMALLFGINVTVIVSYVRDRKEALERSGVATSTFGLIAGVLGVGCASCGSILISLLGLGGALAFLPFGGEEFGFLAIILLIVSTWLMLRKMGKPATCNI